MNISLWPLFLAVATPLIGFGCGAAVRGIRFARTNWRLIAAYYSVLFAAYGFVFTAISFGATEADPFVNGPQLLGCIMILAGPGLAVWLIVEAVRMPAHTKPNVCRTCSYNLTGNISGVCPECGTKV